MSELPLGGLKPALLDVSDNLDSMRVPVNRTETVADTARPAFRDLRRRRVSVGWIDDRLFDEELVLVGERRRAPSSVDRDRPTAYIDRRARVGRTNHAHVLRAARRCVTSISVSRVPLRLRIDCSAVRERHHASKLTEGRSQARSVSRCRR